MSRPTYNRSSFERDHTLLSRICSSVRVRSFASLKRPYIVLKMDPSRLGEPHSTVVSLGHSPQGATHIGNPTPSAA